MANQIAHPNGQQRREVDFPPIAILAGLSEELARAQGTSVEIQNHISGTVSATSLTPTQIRDLQALDLLSQSLSDIRCILDLVIECYPEAVSADQLQTRAQLQGLADRIANVRHRAPEQSSPEISSSAYPDDIDWL